MEIPVNLTLYSVHIVEWLHFLMQNWWYLYKPLGECVRSLKLDLQRKYMDFLLTLFSPVLIMLFLSSCSESLVCIKRFFILFIYLSQLFISWGKWTVFFQYLKHSYRKTRTYIFRSQGCHRDNGYRKAAQCEKANIHVRNENTDLYHVSFLCSLLIAYFLHEEGFQK